MVRDSKAVLKIDQGFCGKISIYELYSNFNFEVFQQKLKQAQSEYNIRVAEGHKPHKRSPKRVTILVSETYLISGGSIHWVKDLESEVFRLCKEYNLDCDELEMESVDRSFVCRNKDSPAFGRKIMVTQFDNYMINKNNFSKEDILLARAIIHYFTYNYYKMEDQLNGTTYYPGKGLVRVARITKSIALPFAKRKGIASCKPKQNRTDISRGTIHGVGKTKLCKK